MKDATVDQLAAVAAPSARMAVFVRIDAPGGTLFLTSVPYDYAWDGHTWLGLGQALVVDAIEETSALSPTRLRVSLQGVTQDLVALILTENMRGSTASVWFAPLNEDFHVINAPEAEWVGRVDVPELDWDPKDDGTLTATASINVEQRLLAMMRRQVLRYTDADQQRLHPGDTAGRHIGRVNGKSVVWPSRTFFT